MVKFLWNIRSWILWGKTLNLRSKEGLEGAPNQVYGLTGLFGRRERTIPIRYGWQSWWYSWISLSIQLEIEVNKVRYSSPHCIRTGKSSSQLKIQEEILLLWFTKSQSERTGIISCDLLREPGGVLIENRNGWARFSQFDWRRGPLGSCLKLPDWPLQQVEIKLKSALAASHLKCSKNYV